LHRSESIVLRQVEDKSSLRQYISLPQRLYQSYANWVPPIYADEWKFHDPKRNLALTSSDVVRVIAERAGKAVGRIMGIHLLQPNEQKTEATRFFNFDCVNDQAVAHSLLHFVEEWAAQEGINKLIGPFGFSDKDPQGLQIEGLEHLPVIAAPSNPPYLPSLLEGEGYTKEFDCLSYKLPIEKEGPPLYEKVYQRILRNRSLKLVEFKTKREIKPYIVPALRLVNETYGAVFGFVPMSEGEMKRLAAQYMPVIDPAFLKVVEDETGQLIGFVIAMPDMSRGIQRAKGRLLPFGFLQMLAAARKTRQLNAMLGAIKQDFRSRGVNVLLGKALMRSALERGFEFIDSHLVLESNLKMCAEYENLGGRIYKRFRVYQKTV
jgi:GNAT superfamily N-acetyltransferase